MAEQGAGGLVRPHPCACGQGGAPNCTASVCFATAQAYPDAQQPPLLPLLLCVLSLQVRQWAESMGAACKRLPESLRCAGSVAQIESLLGTELSVFAHPATGRKIVRTSARATVPAELEGKVLFVSGLQNFPHPRMGSSRPVEVVRAINDADYSIVPEKLPGSTTRHRPRALLHPRRRRSSSRATPHSCRPTVSPLSSNTMAVHEASAALNRVINQLVDRCCYCSAPLY